MCKVSIIMPSLNVAHYIRESVSSVVSQTLRDIEIICVDAGSTDGTLEIIREIAANDNRLSIIESTKKSYGYQMNLGISAARGEYIGIVETDDYVEPEMYETLYKLASENDADLVKADYDMFIEDNDGERFFAPFFLRRECRIEYNKVFSCDEYVSGRFGLDIYIWNGIYKRSFLNKNNVAFNESPGAAFQDFGFRYQTCFFADRIMAVNRACYHYRRDNSNASTYNEKSALFNLEETEFVLKLLKESGDESKLKGFVREIVRFASWPILEELKWRAPSENMRKALEGYRTLMEPLFEQGLITQDNLGFPLCQDARLIREGVDIFLGYAKVFSGLNAENEIKLIRQIVAAETVVIFGTGYEGNAVCVFMKNNGIENIRAFCDNNEKKQHGKACGITVISPEEAVEKFRQALFILSTPKYENEMFSQLKQLGVSEDHIVSYKLPTDPAFCTNGIIREFWRDEKWFSI